jgi:hypothetical protein
MSETSRTAVLLYDYLNLVDYEIFEISVLLGTRGVTVILIERLRIQKGKEA